MATSWLLFVVAMCSMGLGGDAARYSRMQLQQSQGESRAPWRGLTSSTQEHRRS